MRHPSGAPEVCVNCSHNLAAGANGTAGAGSTAQQQGNATAAAALANGGVETESEDDEAEQQAGGDLGAGILQPPLSLSSRLRADLRSAAWGDARPEEAGNAAEEPASQLSSSRDAIRTGGAARQAQRAERAQQAAQGQEASATIAGMMLQGWAMLEQHCPRWVAGGWFRPASGAWQPSLPRCCPCGWRRQHASLTGWSRRRLGNSCLRCRRTCEQRWPAACPPARRCLNPLLRSRDRSRTYCAGCRLDVVQHGQLPQPPSASPAQLDRGQPAANLRKEAEQPAVPASSGVMPAAAGPASVVPALTIASPAIETLPRGPSLPQHVPDVERAAAVVAARLGAAAADLAVAQPGGGALLLTEVQQCATALGALAECRRSMTGLA